MTQAPLSRAEYLARWSQLHAGIDPAANKLVLGWLGLAYVCARPLVALRVTPNVITIVGMLLAAVVPVIAWHWQAAAASNGWLWLAVVLVAVSGLLDNLDGAVAVMTGRTSQWGQVLDAVCDRVADAALLITFGLLGAPWLVVASAVLLSLVQEYARARANALGSEELSTVTIWERPTRIIVTAVFIGLVAWSPFVAGTTWAVTGAVVAFILSVIGFSQVMFAIRRMLSDAPEGA